MKKNEKFVFFLILILIFTYILYKEYNNNKFPFKTYDFSNLTREKFFDITALNEPALFTNSLKHNIDFNDFCKKLGNKNIKARYGDYGTLNGQEKRKFKNIKLETLCKNINNNKQYGGNNIITLKEQIKANIKLNNANFDINRNGKLWIGPKQSSTPLHKDRPKNLSLQIYGIKKWKFFNRKDNINLCFKENNRKLEWSGYSIDNYDTCPSAIKAKLYEIVMKPGYMLYLPEQWAHQVTNESNNIMVNYWDNK